MNFLVDAHFPRRLAHRLRDAGHHAIHTLDLPNQNRTTDEEINDLSIQDERAVITKDADFVDSFLLAQRPHKLLLVSTGDIPDNELENLFEREMSAIVEAFESYDHLELTRTALIFHS